MILAFLLGAGPTLLHFVDRRQCWQCHPSWISWIFRNPDFGLRQHSQHERRGGAKMRREVGEAPPLLKHPK